MSEHDHTPDLEDTLSDDADAEGPDDEEVGVAGVFGDNREAYWDEYRKAALQKKQLKALPRLLRAAFGVVWEAAASRFVILVILQTITGIAAGAILLLGKDALEAILRAQTVGSGFSEVVPKLLIVGGVTAFSKVTLQFQIYVQRQAMELTQRRSLERLLDVACAVPLEYFDDPDFYDKLKRAEFSAQIRPLQLVLGVTGAVGGMIGLAGITAALIAVEPILVPLVGVAYVPVWLAKHRERRAMYETEFQLTPSHRERGYIQVVLTGRDEAKEVRAFGLAGAMRARYDRLSDKVIGDRFSTMRKRLKVEFVAELATIALTGGILGLLIWMVLSGRMELAAAAAAVAAVQMMSTRLEATLGSMTSLYETTLYLEDLVSFLDLKPEVDAARPTAPAPQGFGTLKVESLSFVYPGSTRRVLRDVALEIRAGEIIALVGENGSGKTTLAKMLAGLYQPTAGRILWDNTDIATVDPDQLRSSIALIFQDFVRYKLPARENIGVGRFQHMDDLEAIQRAARHAGADSFLTRLPKGYETILSKEFADGRDLSIGQWQRVALARAFFRDAPFIILDEPTASLDPRAERALFDSIRTLASGRSVLLISHRFSSVRSADRTYVLKHGEVVEHGSHEELMAMDGLYAELFTLQASAYLDTAEPAR